MAAFPVNRREPRTAVATGPPVPPVTILRAATALTTASTTRTARPSRPSTPSTPSLSSRPSASSRPRLRVTVTRSAPGTTGAVRWAIDTAVLAPEPAQHLHALVDAVEAGGAPAGPAGSGGLLTVRAAGAAAVWEVTVARGFGHWTARLPGASATTPLTTTALTALIDHVRGVPDPG